jgi:hypothetical protein
MAAFSLRQIRFLRSLGSARGTPYVWGGTSLQNGVDCSGLVYRAAIDAGIHGVPRTSEEQFMHGTPVQMGGLRPGDLIFSNWGNEVGAGHVSIYAGNGKIIEAARPGTNVHVVPMSVLSGHIIGARRYLAGAGQGLPNVSAFARQQIAYHAQASGGQQQGNPAAALGQMRQPLQIQPLKPLQTAGQTLQNTFAPPPPATLQQAPSAFPASIAPTTTALSGQLDALHQQLLSKPLKM